MAVHPLFIASMSTLKAKLRLSGAAQTDALAILDDVVERVRIDIYDALGTTRAAEVVAMTYSENPTTEEGILRAKANALELSMVRYALLRRLPVLFMDASGDAKQAWNEEAFSRMASPSELDKELERLRQEIDFGLSGLISGSQQDGGEQDITVTVPESNNLPPNPGESAGIVLGPLAPVRASRVGVAWPFGW